MAMQRLGAGVSRSGREADSPPAAVSGSMPAQATADAKSARRRRLVKVGIRLLGPLLLVIVILRMRDASVVFSSLRHADPMPLALALLLNVVCNYLKVVRWDVLLAARGYRY